MVKILEELPPEGSNRGKRVRCRCNCGAEFVARKSNVLAGRTQSCGCKKTGRPRNNDVVTETVVTTPKAVVTKLRPAIKPRVIIQEPEEDGYDRCEELIEKVTETWDKTREQIAESINLRVHQMEDLSYSELYDALERAGAI